ncbi:hypothetical protein Ddye_023054 [Dipteronia dyeriana]|uniref:CCHC-type domain-containing protein n=1 Tax=Dipteronia dyeriana TaxID=168575 RepID=A0AAD9TSD7_9ROSI|nr:hypothetical protein Ddye_023054 [Dipteronia dyeriana]
MIHEQRLAQLNSATQIDIPQASANFVSGNQNDRRNQRGGYNGNNGRINGNKRRGRGRNNSGWNNNNRPICQMCGKIGHVSFNGFHRFDRNFQGSNQNTNGYQNSNFQVQSV